MIKALEKVNPYKLLFLDIETRAEYQSITKEDNPEVYATTEYIARYRKEAEGFDSIEEFYENKSPLFAELGEVCCISVGVLTKDNKLRCKSFHGVDERIILNEFKEFLEGAGRGFTLCHFAGKNFDEPFVLKRMLANGISDVPPVLDNIDVKPWLIESVDLRELMKANMYYSPSLMSTAYMLGLPSPKQKIEGGEVNDAFWDGKLETIREYCEGDVLTTANIFLKITGRELADYDEQTKMEGMPLLKKIGMCKVITKQDEKEILKRAEGLEPDEIRMYKDLVKAAVCVGKKGDDSAQKAKIDTLFAKIL